jgi:hypothetical protein
MAELIGQYDEPRAIPPYQRGQRLSRDVVHSNDQISTLKMNGYQASI